MSEKAVVNLQLRKALAGMQGRALALHNRTASPIAMEAPGGNRLDKVMEAALASVSDPEHLKKMAELMKRQRGGDQEAVTELNALRTQTIDLYVRAMSNWLMFFEPVNLAKDEQLAFLNTYRNMVNVRFQGQDGGPRTVKAVRGQKVAFLDMRELHTDEVEYPVRDINQGPDVLAAAQKTVDLGWDMANKVDVEAFNVLNTGTSVIAGKAIFGPFATTGAPLSRTYIPNPRINSANLPNTNILDATSSSFLSDNSGTTKFRMAVCRAVLAYCEAWGNIWGAPIRPTGTILVPSSEVTDLASEITPTSLIMPSPLAQELLSNYTQFDYMNVRWTLVPDVTLAKGTCYPILNRPVGQVFYKPEFDEEFVDTDRKKNIETRSAMKVIQFAVPEPNRVNIIKAVYHT